MSLPISVAAMDTVNTDSPMPENAMNDDEELIDEDENEQEMWYVSTVMFLLIWLKICFTYSYCHIYSYCPIDLWSKILWIVAHAHLA